MASSLQLRLERAISANRVSSALELPLDRKLGDLSRYTYVYADALPLRLERKIIDQPAPNALHLALSQPLGTLAPVMYVTSNALPLPLSELISEQPPSNALPLSMTRKLGTVSGGYVPPSPPVNQNVNLTIRAKSDIAPKMRVSVTAERVITNIAIRAKSNINPKMRVTASYDANVFRGPMRDVSSDAQNSKLTGVGAKDGFEANALLSKSIASDMQPSRGVDAALTGRFEANEQLQSARNLAFDTSRKISNARTVLAETMIFTSMQRRIDYETTNTIRRGNQYQFEAMAQLRAALSGGAEYANFIDDKLSTYSEYARLVAHEKSSLTEFARLPFNTVFYLPPPIWQTVILRKKPDDLSGAAFGDEVLSYVYSSALPLAMRRRVRPQSSALPLTMDRPRSMLRWSQSETPDLAEVWTNDRIARVNRVDDITLCTPKNYRRISTSAAIIGRAQLSPLMRLWLTVSDGTIYDDGVIFVTNSVSLTRTDGRNINLFDFNVGIDTNSYCWTFSANVPLAELPKVDTSSEAQIGVELTVNGHLWRFILDGCDDSIAFGERSLSIKGKSRAMLLAHPYAQSRGYKYDAPMTARQIADDELNRGNVPSGFTLDWDLVGVNGWDIPAGTYSYSNKTPINSLQWIAEAGGGFINSDMSADTIHVNELYKIPSWEWSAQTPLLNLPPSLILSRNQTRISKPAYNGVMVYGEREGSVGALIKRRGTAGGYQLPMVTSDLITTNAVAANRGQAILSDTGDMADVSVTMPLHSDFGVLKPATLIGVNDGQQWVGMVRGTSIKGKLSNQQTLEIEQTLSIERHFEEA